jgi:hypothetical protein
MRTTDINMDVTDAVKIWLSGSSGATIPNYGFLLQFSDADELNRFISKGIYDILVEKHILYMFLN